MNDSRGEPSGGRTDFGVRRTLVLALLVGSTLATAAGLLALVNFDQTPGNLGNTPARWPDQTEIRRNGGRATLLVFLHPWCPCSDSTLGNLELARQQSGPNAASELLIAFAVPNTDERPGSGENSLLKRAAEIPGARVLSDQGGRIAASFGARTSGMVLLYNPEGELLFRGGITPSRGHAGQNRSLDRLIQALASGKKDRSRNPVFGCALPSRDQSVRDQGSHAQ